MGGAAIGIAFALAWIDAPRLLVCGTYLACGWAGAIAVPQLLTKVGVAAFVLFLIGGLLYSAGATIYATRRPNPWPKTFGFHELFHLLVIAAAVVHFIAMAAWVVPHAAADPRALGFAVARAGSSVDRALPSGGRSRGFESLPAR